MTNTSVDDNLKKIITLCADDKNKVPLNDAWDFYSGIERIVQQEIGQRSVKARPLPANYARDKAYLITKIYLKYGEGWYEMIPSAKQDIFNDFYRGRHG